MSTRKFESALTFKREFDSIRTALSQTETEDSWEAIARAISTLTILCQNASCDFPAEVIAVIRIVSRPLSSAMNSERTRLSGVAIDLLGTLAAGLEAAFDPLLPLFFPTLISLCARTNKVFVTRARTSILTIIEGSQLPSILPYLLQSLKDKSVSLRLMAIEGVLACMNCFNPPDLEKEGRAKDIESAIRLSARDASADVRKISRKTFEAYKVLLPSRVESFMDPLTPTTKKYLGIKPTRAQPIPRPQSSQESRPRPRPNSQIQLSASTSAMSLATSTLSTSTSSHPHYSESSSAITTATQGKSAAIRDADHPERPGGQNRTTRETNKMPPPDCIPVRPSQPVRKAVIKASRSQPVVPDRQRTISAPVSAQANMARRLNHPPSVAPIASDANCAQRFNTNVIKSEGPIRPQTVSQAGIVRDQMSIARRVPVEDTLLTRPNSRGENSTASRHNAPSRSTLTSPKATTSRPVPRLNRKPSAPNLCPQPVAEHSKLLASKSASAVPVASRIDRPTLSQTSHAKVDVIDSKSVKTRTTTSKPIWGSAASRTTVPATKPLKIGSQTQLSKKTSKRLKATGDSERAKESPYPSRKATPTQIPLPPSPMLEPVKTIHNEETAHTEVAVSTDASVADAPQVGDAERAAVENVEVTADNGLSATPPTQQAASPNRTPISSLLTSIQQGFLFTPSSPLSPPQSYLPLTADMPPFPLKELELAGSANHQVFSRVTTGFGTGKIVVKEDANRNVLGSVEVNQRNEGHSIVQVCDHI